MNDYRGKLCLVTGASSGLGAALACGLAAQGASLVLVGRDQARLDAVKRQCQTVGGSPVIVVACDLTDWTACQTLVETQSIQLCRNFDLVVHSAGTAIVGRIVDVPIERVQACIAVNVLSAFALARAIIPTMAQAAQGHIVLVSSGTAYFGIPGESAYSASKAALERFGEGLRQETTGTGIAVTIVSPGPMETPLMRQPQRFGNFPMLARPARAPTPAVIAQKILAKLPTRPRRIDLSWRVTVARLLACLAPFVLEHLLAPKHPK